MTNTPNSQATGSAPPPPPPPPGYSVHLPPPPSGSYASSAQSTDSIASKLIGLKPYWQKELTKIHNSNGAYRGKFNFPAFFFGALWALTKGLWANVLVMILIASVFYAVLPESAWVVVNFAIGGFYGAYGNMLVYKKQILGKQPVF